VGTGSLLHASILAAVWQPPDGHPGLPTPGQKGCPQNGFGLIAGRG
jgi:hypothetical protein